MKFQLKLLALAALGLAATVPAHADIASGASGNGELFLSVWDNMGTIDTADDRSYTRDLGSLMNTWASATTNPAALMASQNTAGYSLSFSADALLGSWLAAGNQANMLWNVGAVDSLGTKRMLSTVSDLGLINQNTYAALRNAALTANTYLAGVNNLTDPTNSAAVNDSISVVGNVTSDASLPTVWNNNFGGMFSAGFNNAGQIGNSLDFFQFSETVSSGSTTTAVKVNQFTSAFDNGTLLADGSAAKWKLNAAGDLSYSVAGAPAAVPVPAAAWLLGSGLIGMVGVARRKAA